MRIKTDEDDRDETPCDLEQLREQLDLPGAPWQVLRDNLLDRGSYALAEDVGAYFSEPGPKIWVTCDVLTYGDYGGAGSLGVANVRALKRDLPEDQWEEENGYYYSVTLWLLDTPENRDIIKALEDDYSLYDEDEHSKVEMEWEEEAWNDYGWADLRREARDQDWYTEEWEDEVDDLLTPAQMFECYREAMEAANAYPTFEYSGAALPLDDIVTEFYEATQRMLHPKVPGANQPAQRYLPGM